MRGFPIDYRDIDIDAADYLWQLDDLLGLIRTVESGLDKSAHELETRADKISEKLKEYESKHGGIKNYEQSSFFYDLDFVVAQHDMLKDQFPNIVRGGLFLSIYAFVEHSLNGLCEQCRLEHGIRVTDLRGSGPERARAYLKKSYGITIPDEVLLGAEFKLLRMIRNSLVHCAGEIPAGEEANFKRLCTECLLNREVELQKHGYLQLNANFLEWFVVQAKHMFSGVCKELSAYVERKRQEQGKGTEPRSPQ